MLALIVIVLVILALSGGWGYYGSSRYGPGWGYSPVGAVVLILAVLYLLGLLPALR